MKAELPATLIGLPDLRVKLGGTLAVPTLINHSGRNIIGYVLRVESDTGITALPVFKLGSLARNPLESAGVVQGGKDVPNPGAQAGMQRRVQEVHKDGTPVVTQRVSVDSVVFSDGEFAGPDTVHIFD